MLGGALTEKYTLHRFIDGSAGYAYVWNLKAAQSLYKNLQPVVWEADKWYYFEQLGYTNDCPGFGCFNVWFHKNYLFLIKNLSPF